MRRVVWLGIGATLGAIGARRLGRLGASSVDARVRRETRRLRRDLAAAIEAGRHEVRVATANERSRRRGSRRSG
ncbi:hypothetical protein Afer_0950 [Acidimicrobium ferrooxidans DSM 10331]|uniref:Uncharacterized protein n=1 Tax=Acidimicrobium ferrooxidans (strain DSM 10331 / JCM 15462 / NBRC 103882 / ICP) TaxID=525909 RepID=C7LYT1_ACIFD|nr:hypothetical protein [Acidimicrobium ferrooxidans]ACU53889.1 hypothetical protein Afer_0950 [Acidimicrobium ferrooxidans DSM 10331]